jgi:hypothetical protein
MNNGERRYEAIDPISRDTAEAAAAGEADILLRAILAVALHDDDLAWAEAFCERFARHPDPSVRGSVLDSFGHRARRFGRIDERIRPLLEAGLADQDPWVRSKAEDAAGDVKHFVGWQLEQRS